jgi:hypothetical protein
VVNPGCYCLPALLGPGPVRTTTNHESGSRGLRGDHRAKPDCSISAISEHPFRSFEMSEQEISAKLDDIVARLERIEQRQIAVREEIKETAPPVVGSFASTEQK